jgi:hypothetical protein
LCLRLRLCPRRDRSDENERAYRPPDPRAVRSGERSLIGALHRDRP